MTKNHAEEKNLEIEKVQVKQFEVKEAWLT